MLGDTYEVRNFGHSGAAVLRNGHHPYTDTPEYKAALAYKADIAVIHLGVNDTDPRSWPNFSHEFTSDYLYIIQQLRNSNPDIRIIVAKLTPLKPHIQDSAPAHGYGVLKHRILLSVSPLNPTWS